MKWSKKLFTVLLALVTVTAQNAMAMTAPTAGDFMFEFYDVAVNGILLGAPGFVGSVALIVYGGTLLMRNWLLGVAAILAGTLIINADAITTSMGMLV